MQIRESNFFATQIPHSNRYTINQSINADSNRDSTDKKHPSIRVRQAKSQAKKLASVYTQALKQYLKTKNSIDKSSSKTHKLREQFVKLYSNKKSKYANKSMMQSKKHQEQESQLQASNRVRTMKLNNDLGIMYTKNQCQALNNKIKHQNRKLVQDLKRKLRVTKKQQLDYAKSKFQQIKKGQTQFLIRKKNMSAMVETRAHHNHLLKVSHQMEILDNYTKLLEHIEKLKQVDVTNKAQLQSFSKTFFVTTKNTFS